MLPLHITWSLVKGSLSSITLTSASHFSYSIESDQPSLEPLIHRWMECYLSKKPLPPIPLHMDSYTPFRKAVLLAIQEISPGETKSYSQIASLVGRPDAQRAVGRVCHTNPFPLFIPCHRVIQKNGSLGGFALSLDVKKNLLEFEAL